MTPPIHVTEAESEVLAALWRSGPLTPTRLVEAVKARRDWADATIKTLLGRLMQKKAVRSRRDDGRLTYEPLVTLDAYVAAEARRLADRIFDGDPARLAEFLIERFGASDRGP
ncbi:MAG TPA: BlaI/MecI/CopY family transcriptional regulator [Caulobacteraceae bacterium]|jgi:predicted transcriptional regulator|nr:BlaI/MecI/CopY family transcriptional regulator [Caulobacteraceae bacterium]